MATPPTMPDDLVPGLFAMAIPEDGPAATKFIEEVLKIIATRSDIDATLLTAKCKALLECDVEIRKTPRGYEITFVTLLIIDKERSKAAIDYAVQWIIDHPLVILPLESRQHGPQQLTSDGIFIFMFIPSSRPLPSDNDMEFMARQAVPKYDPGRTGWLVKSQPYDDAANNQRFINDTIGNWLAGQHDQDGIQLRQAKASTRERRELSFLVVTRRK